MLLVATWKMDGFEFSRGGKLKIFLKILIIYFGVLKLKEFN